MNELIMHRQEEGTGKGLLGTFARAFLITLIIVITAGAGICLYFLGRAYGESGAFPWQRVSGGSAPQSGAPAGTGGKAVRSSWTADQNAKDYTTVALFGVDSREGELLSGNNRADVMMVLAIHKRTGEAHIVSVYRDTYLDIGDGVYTKCNAAYAYGGPDQAVDMLNECLDLDIRDYIAIGFGGLADLIDDVGGVEIALTEEEVPMLNDYQRTMADELGRAMVPVTAAGMQRLTGLQAVAYCRIRYTAGDDFRRTERQREVLTQTFAGIGRLGPRQLFGLTTDVLSKTATSMDLGRLFQFAAQLVKLDIRGTAGLPGADMRMNATIGGQAVVVPSTLADNVVWLHGFLYGTEDYAVSARVSEISAGIEKAAGR